MTRIHLTFKAVLLESNVYTQAEVNTCELNVGSGRNEYLRHRVDIQGDQVSSGHTRESE